MMARSRELYEDLTFRVDGLPSPCNRGTAIALIEAAAHLNPGRSDVKVYSLAARAVGTRETTATITSIDLAQVLQPPPSQASRRWTLALPKPPLLAARVGLSSSGEAPDEDDHDISIDTHFEGFTPLCSFDDGARHKLE